MKLHEQRDQLRQAAQEAYDALLSLTGRIMVKTAMPYGDGSFSNMVNASSDVIPQLTDIRLKLLEALYDDKFGRLE